MSSQQKVRSACENCHRRKVKCHLPTAGGACQNCSTTGNSCYFAPRVKAGRPRLTDSVQRQPSYHHSSSQSPRLSNVAFPESTSVPSLSGGSHSSPSSLFQASRNVGETALVDELHTFGFMSPVPTNQTREQNTSFQASISTPSNRLLDESIPGFLDSSSTPLEIAEYGLQTPPSSFDSILKSCGDLDRHFRSLEGLNYHIDNLYAVLNSMDSACLMSMQASPSLLNSDGAFIALIVAAFHRVFEICKKIIANIWSTSMHPEQTPDMLILLKRLDLILLQAKIVLVKINNLDGAKTALQIHQWIDSCEKQRCHSWLW